jgi:CRISPR-associated protein Csm2
MAHPNDHRRQQGNPGGQDQRNRGSGDHSRSQGKDQDEQIKTIVEAINKKDSLAFYPAKDLVEHAEKVAAMIRDLKTAQIRKIYGEVKRLELDFQGEGGFNQDKVIFLRPKLAYAANKQGSVIPLKEVLNACIVKITNKEDFARFVTFFEAILAYHSDKKQNREAQR